METKIATTPSPDPPSHSAAGNPLLPQLRSLSPRNIQPWILAAAVLGSLIAAWIHIRSTTIWYDEAITLLITSGHAFFDPSLGSHQFQPTANLLEILRQLFRHDVHPPLYFWTLAIWRLIFGRSLEVARALSAAFTVATLVLLYRYAEKLGARWPGVPPVVYALSAVGLRYAYNARSYAMATFLIVLTLLLAEKKSKWTGVTAAACVTTHYFAALCVGPIIAIEFLRWFKTDRRWAWWTAASFAALCSPLTIVLAQHLGARPEQYRGFGGFRKELGALLRGSLQAATSYSFHWSPWRYIAMLVVAGFALAGAVWAINRKLWVLPLGFASFLLGFLLIAIMTHKSIVKMPYDYYLGIAAPLLVLLIWLGAQSFPTASALLAAALIFSAFTSTPIMALRDYRQMVAEIRPNCDHCAILVGYGWGGAVAACVLYEAQGLDVYLLNVGDTVERVDARIGPGRVIYLIPSTDPPTTPLEETFARKHAVVSENGFFKIAPAH